MSSICKCECLISCLTKNKMFVWFSKPHKNQEVRSHCNIRYFFKLAKQEQTKENGWHNCVLVNNLMLI